MDKRGVGVEINNWWLIIAKDGSCQGYMPGETKEVACEKLGLKFEACFIKRVIWTEDGFIEPNQIVQGKLL